jgi:NADH dehydrogenase
VVDTGARPPHVVIVGGGFGGLTAATELRGAPVRITLVDRANHHLFQPLLYQVAMTGLSPADIAAPIRSVLRQQKNATVLLAEVQGVDLQQKKLRLDHGGELAYDFLLLAVGASNFYFGHDDWARFAVGLKDLDDAVEVRRRVLLAFEAAERAPSAEERQRLLTFVVVGGGPTGVELAGALAELSRFVLARDFRNVDPTGARIVLLEGSPRILGTFPEKLSQRAEADLKRLGAEVRAQTKVTRIDEQGVHIGDELLPTATVLWAAGVRPAPLTASLGAPLDHAGRVLVEPDLTLPGHPEVFALGDMAAFLHQDGRPLPGTSPVAMQQARHAAASIRATLRGQPRTKFRYVDKGNMATIGRAAAIVHIKRLQLSGFLAWLFWLMVHIFFLITFRNRIAVLANWAYSYFTYKRGARLITGHRLSAGPASLSSAEVRPLPAPTPTNPPPSPPRA